MIRSLGTFDSRDELFRAYGQTLPRPYAWWGWNRPSVAGSVVTSGLKN
ncbi:hypothetical protein GS446_24800 [Rhodococcus hoagii]|nr:hypothetical protein [Prescottella equi]